MRVFVAGASGAVGRPLIKCLIKAGFDTYGLASKPESVGSIAGMGATPILGNALDRESVFAAFDKVRPDVVIDQLTSLPSDPADMPDRLPFDRKLRLEGGSNILAAAEAYGAQRYLQQSSGFYLDGEGGLANESSKLRINAPGHIGVSSRMYAELERRVLDTSRLAGTVLRYGFFYGPGTWYWHEGRLSDQVRRGHCPILRPGHSTFSFIHVEDAAAATVAALKALPGIYIVVDDRPVAASQFYNLFARWLDAPAPQWMETPEALAKFGEEAVYFHNALSGARNCKTRDLISFSSREAPWFKEA